MRLFEIVERLYIAINKIFPYKGKVLMFHHITDKNIDTIPCCICKIEKFKEIIRELAKDHEFIHVEDVYKKHHNKIAVITFDDSNSDVFENAYPFLQEMHIPFTVFIANRLIGVDGMINEKQIRVYAKDPLVTIGFHTHSHSFLSISKNKKWEIDKSRIILEEIIGQPINVFAYPYGKLYPVGLKAIKIAKKAGYSMAFGTFDANITVFSRFFRFYLPRVVIN